MVTVASGVRGLAVGNNCGVGGPERQLELPPQPGSAAVARRFVADALAATGAEQREIAILLTSELVTNALLYAQSPITVRVLQRGPTYRVGVRDEAPAEVRPRHVGIDATSGRGLSLVQRLSAAWGVDDLDRSGKEVWFELPRDGGGPA